ncbi:MAG: TIR domain-containing protein [Chloroflexota bacterium]
MSNEKARIFISYARKDGEAFAKDLRQKLITQFDEDTIWQDRTDMEGGISWWKQITTALENVEFMVLIATPAAMASPIVKKEWRYARQQGVCVYPLQVPDLPIDFGSLPHWMRDSHFYDLTTEEQNQKLINDLNTKCTAVRVPFYGVPDLPEHFVERPEVFEQMKTQLLDDARDNPVAITTSLVGAGGFGKTTLASALCHDEDVQTAFDDGVLWVTLGENPNLS